MPRLRLCARRGLVIYLKGSLASPAVVPDHGRTPALLPSEQAVDDAHRADAKARYEEGVAAYTSGHFKDAVDLFLAADRLSPSAPLSFNIARAYEKLGDDAGALRWYRDYLRRSPAAKNARDVAVLVQHFEGRLESKGVQQLTVLSTPDGATIAIDSAPIGVTPGTFELAPGKHHVALMLRGFTDAERDVELAPDRAQDVSLELAPKSMADESAPPGAQRATEAAGAAQQPQQSAPAASASGGLGPWPFATLGAGAAALGGALTFEAAPRELRAERAEKAGTQVEYKQELDRMHSQRTTARVLAVAGGALVVTGGVLLAIELGSSKRPSTGALRLLPTSDGFTSTFTGSF